MTTPRYYFCLIFQIFGFNRRNIRTADAASETHLLKEAEYFLGKESWEKIEGIEALAVEYWNLRKIILQRATVIAELEKNEKYLAEAHEQRADMLGVNTQGYSDLTSKRKATLVKLEELAVKRDSIVSKAREIRRLYEGLRVKHEVLALDDKQSSEELEETLRQISELKAEFAYLKDMRQEIGDEIVDGEEQIDRIDKEIQQRKLIRRSEASDAFQQISEANHQISTLRAELGVLDTQLHQIYVEIGRFLSRNTQFVSQCKEICKEYRGLVEVMGALRRSIQLNYLLAEKA